MKKKVKKIFISIFAFVLISAVIYLGAVPKTAVQAVTE